MFETIESIVTVMTWSQHQMPTPIHHSSKIRNIQPAVLLKYDFKFINFGKFVEFLKRSMVKADLHTYFLIFQPEDLLIHASKFNES